jgi:hypothetical protein
MARRRRLHGSEGTSLAERKRGGKKGTACSLPPLGTATTARGRGSVAPMLNCGGAGAWVDGSALSARAMAQQHRGSDDAGGAEAA